MLSNVPEASISHDLGTSVVVLRVKLFYHLSLYYHESHVHTMNNVGLDFLMTLSAISILFSHYVHCSLSSFHLQRRDKFL